MTEFEMVCCVVNRGQGSKALKIAKKSGVKGGTIVIGRGTVHSRLLDLFELTDTKKEVVFMIADKETALKAADGLHREMAMHKPNHGIVFTFSISGFIGTRQSAGGDMQSGAFGSADGAAHDAIFAVVARGSAEETVKAANEAGAGGGTVMNARGAGAGETSTLFSTPIEPEKEMVMLLAPCDMTGAIVSAIRARMQIDQPGRGILFVITLAEAYGIQSITGQ